ncbi:MAG: glycosyltransferase [Pseudomonadota bacterium]
MIASSLSETASDLTTSVLMCTYAGDDPDQLAACLDSLIGQSKQADEIVLVCDGPLPASVDNVVIRYDKAVAVLRVIRCEHNRGLVAALNEGLRHCSGDVVLRMDSDDLAHQDRIKLQVSYLTQHEAIGVLGTSMQEFTGHDVSQVRLKPVAMTHAEILKQMPWRNPMNHPTVAIRRDLLVKAGGYPDLKYLEDYFLWARLAVCGVRMANLDRPLVLYRFDDQTLARRGGWLNLRHEMYLRWWMYRHRLMGPVTLMATLLSQVVLRLAPLGVRRWLWRRSRVSSQTDPVS